MFLERDPGWTEWISRNGDDPRFLAVMDKARANRDQQAQRILAITASNDIDALLAVLEARARVAVRDPLTQQLSDQRSRRSKGHIVKSHGASVA